VRDIELFPGTILDNIRLGRPQVSYDAVADALRAVGLLEDVRALPDGLDTHLHPHGRPLSGRQAWLLMIARAIVEQPRLLVLDGMLDRIESPSERAPLVELIFAAGAPWTLVCISDRADLLARCDRVITLPASQVR
jgi:putative ABC transport system ATP-binding protein